MDLLGELPGQRAHRRACSRRSGGLDQVGDTLGLGEIELAVEKGATGEFTRLGQAGAELKAALEQHLHDHGSTVALQLEHVFAGEGGRRSEIKKDALVDCPLLLVEEAGEVRGARPRCTAAQREGKGDETGAGDADDTDAAAARRRRDRGDRVRRACRPTFHFRSSA